MASPQAYRDNVARKRLEAADRMKSLYRKLEKTKSISSQSPDNTTSDADADFALAMKIQSEEYADSRMRDEYVSRQVVSSTRSDYRSTSRGPPYLPAPTGPSIVSGSASVISRTTVPVEARSRAASQRQKNEPVIQIGDNQTYSRWKAVEAKAGIAYYTNGPQLMEVPEALEGSFMLQSSTNAERPPKGLWVKGADSRHYDVWCAVSAETDLEEMPDGFRRVYEPMPDGEVILDSKHRLFKIARRMVPAAPHKVVKFPKHNVPFIVFVRAVPGSDSGSGSSATVPSASDSSVRSVDARGSRSTSATIGARGQRPMSGGSSVGHRPLMEDQTLEERLRGHLPHRSRATRPGIITSAPIGTSHLRHRMRTTGLGSNFLGSDLRFGTASGSGRRDLNPIADIERQMASLTARMSASTASSSFTRRQYTAAGSLFGSSSSSYGPRSRAASGSTSGASYSTSYRVGGTAPSITGAEARRRRSRSRPLP